ncbi:hypothetical protein L798_03230 [Zootermopsis nevadensis]|uniref:Uncharacterized protein n=1 Tax=Zootermopsis nevadensis TaxID=136037 RepID=A0A067QGI6_ZOONE|nr:hypothetical protein L798_03230 [Zootermopsis nevadensis]
MLQVFVAGSTGGCFQIIIRFRDASGKCARRNSFNSDRQYEVSSSCGVRAVPNLKYVRRKVFYRQLLCWPSRAIASQVALLQDVSGFHTQFVIAFFDSSCWTLPAGFALIRGLTSAFSGPCIFTSRLLLKPP